MKNLLLLFTIFSLTACTSSDDNSAADTTTPPTAAETIIGNWTTQFTESEGTVNGRITFTESGEMSIYLEITPTGSDETISSVEGKTWTLDGDQFSTTDTLDNDTDTDTLTVNNQDSISILTTDGETLNLTRVDAYETSLIGDWEGTDPENCISTVQISFTNSNTYSSIVTNMDCENEVINVGGTFTRNSGTLSGTLSFVDEITNETNNAYYAVQGDAMLLFFEGSDDGYVLFKQ